MFLTKNELNTVTSANTVDLITNSDEEAVEAIITECIDLMASYLHNRYDTEVIFAAEGNDRNLTVVRHLKSLVIADLYNIRKKVLPEGMMNRYNEAMRWLEKVAKGELEPDLPRLDQDGDGEPDTWIKTGSNTKYPNHF